MRIVRVGAVIALAITGLSVAAVHADAATIQVSAGQSIQAAVNAASPGDTIRIGPGIFHEQVVVAKSNLTIVGSGTVIQQPGPATPFGLCVSGGTNCANVGPPVHDVTVSGITVDGFPQGEAFEAVDAQHVTFSNDTATNSRIGFGTAQLADSTFSNDVAQWDQTGVYTSFSTFVTVQGAQLMDDSYGLIMSHSDGVTARLSVMQRDCVGLVDASFSGQTYPITITENVFAHNNSTCVGLSGLVPATQGVGAYFIDAVHAQVSHNAFQSNGTPTNQPLASDGGLVVMPTPSQSGSSYTGNAFSNNVPLDILTDDVNPADNVFALNSCHLSNPAGLCV